MPSPKNTFRQLKLHDLLADDFQLKSRVHKLRSFAGNNVFIKRDDELSSGISGSKFRKYASLLPFLRKSNFHEIVLIGSAQSNNIVGLLQLLTEVGISPKLMMLESNEPDKKGNLLWLSLLYDLEKVSWIKRADWPRVNEMAYAYVEENASSGKKIFVIEEGAAVAQSIPGAITLAEDILRNEKEMKIAFENVFIDSGSGTTAIALLYGFALAGIKDKRIFITLIAGTEEEFNFQYKKLVKEAAAIYAWPEKCFEGEIYFSKPTIAPAFGSITRQVLEEVKFIARTEGILAEPVYTAKHFSTARNIIQNQNIRGNSLIINGGGSLGLAGFQHKLNS